MKMKQQQTPAFWGLSEEARPLAEGTCTSGAGTRAANSLSLGCKALISILLRG